MLLNLPDAAGVENRKSYHWTHATEVHAALLLCFASLSCNCIVATAHSASDSRDAQVVMADTSGSTGKTRVQTAAVRKSHDIGSRPAR